MNEFKIMIIEDEESIRKQLADFLSGYGYKVAVISEFNDIVPNVLEETPDLVLLDVNLPVNDGYFVCREIRKKSKVPIIIVTSRDTEMDEIMSMNIGADDFVTKPYNTQVLLARIESVLRRTQGNMSDPTLVYRELELNVGKGTIIYKNNEESLTKNELKILYYLMQHQGEIVSREQIMKYLWSSELFVDDNTLSVNITRLRKKIEAMGLDNPIETRRGLGYILP